VWGELGPLWGDGRREKGSRWRSVQRRARNTEGVLRKLLGSPLKLSDPTSHVTRSTDDVGALRDTLQPAVLEKGADVDRRRRSPTLVLLDLRC